MIGQRMSLSEATDEVVEMADKLVGDLREIDNRYVSKFDEIRRAILEAVDELDAAGRKDVAAPQLALLDGLILDGLKRAEHEVAAKTWLMAAYRLGIEVGEMKR